MTFLRPGGVAENRGSYVVSLSPLLLFLSGFSPLLLFLSGFSPLSLASGCSGLRSGVVGV